MSVSQMLGRLAVVIFAGFMFGTAIGLAARTVVSAVTPSHLAVIGILALFPVLVVLYDEWRYPATGFTYRGPR